MSGRCLLLNHAPLLRRVLLVFVEYFFHGYLFIPAVLFHHPFAYQLQFTLVFSAGFGVGQF